MKYGMIVYRILSFIVNLFCVFAAMITIIALLFLLQDPSALLQVFLMGGVVLYGWYANKFYVYVLMGKQKMTKRQKDWLQVNAIVSFIFSVLGIVNCLLIINNPHVFDEALKNMPLENANSVNVITNAAIVFLSLCSFLFVHVVWTYILIRKYKNHFDE
jgi:hypothetical protein